MKRITRLTLAAGAVAVSGLGCSNSAEPGSSGSNLSISVAPLELPAMTDACYQLTAYNENGVPGEDFDEDERIWTQPHLCASQYGAAGGIRFTGICDANAGGAEDPDHYNTLQLVLTDIYKDGTFATGTALTAGTDYINPCPSVDLSDPSDNGCVINAPCHANQDTKVEFNLTVMRQASLGFFDTVVKFQDVFCAAKLDCVESDGTTTLSYLHDPTATPPADGPTAVLGFTCLGGSGADVNMYLDDLVIECTRNGFVTRTATVDPSDGPGNVSATQSTQTEGFDAPVLFGAAVNIGAGFQGSRYWNVMLGMNLNDLDEDETCTLRTRGTVSETSLTSNTTPTNNRYPYIDWNVPLFDGESGRTCTRHPLNAGNGVGTDYTAVDAPHAFDHELQLDLVCPCWNIDTVLTAAQTIMSGSFEYDFELDDDETELELDSENGELGMGLEANSEEFWCGFAIEDVAGISDVSAEHDISAAEYAVCRTDLMSVMDNQCTVNNGGCAGATPYCAYAGPGLVSCGECTSNSDCTDPDAAVCDLSGTQYGNPATQYSCVECAGPLYACPQGQWCSGDGSCQAPPTWVNYGVASYSFQDNAQAEAACAVESRRLPTTWELQAALAAQFVYGTPIPGITFVADQYYGAPTPGDGVAVWRWNGATVEGPWNNTWGNGTFAVCLP